MPPEDADRVEESLKRALGAPGREYDFGVVLVDGIPSEVWRTYEIPPYTAIFRFMTAEQRR